MILIVTRLGIIACRYLVKGYAENRYVSAPEIAEYYNMNVRALMPALRQLTRVGILRSRVGGVTPGFIFARNPAEITMHEILSALEGDPKFACCKELISDLKCDCTDKSQCGIFHLLSSLIEHSVNKLSTISIADHI